MIKFGSLTGRREREDYRIDEAELECGQNIYNYIRTIEKTLSFEDEFPTCSIGVILDENDQTNYFDVSTGLPVICLESVEVRLRENARPKYKPDRIYTLAEVIQLSQDGTAVSGLACTLQVRMVEVELRARYKSDGNTYLTPVEILRAKTADGAVSITDLLGFNPNSFIGNWTVAGKSVDKPIDDFWSQEVIYRGRIAYPSSTLRNAYINPVETVLGITINEDYCTVEISAELRTGDNPRRRIDIRYYGLRSVNE